MILKNMCRIRLKMVIDVSEEDLTYFQKYYWEKKKKLVSIIAGELYENGGHPKNDASVCEKCEKKFPLSLLTFHHPNENRGEREMVVCLCCQKQRKI